jgi:putative colanic acid biosynthesis acetyltransferase WcaF
MPYRNRPINLRDGSWVGAQVFVAPGVTIGTEAVISAGSVVTSDQPPRMVCGGNPCSALKNRWPDELAQAQRQQQVNEPGTVISVAT